MTERDLGKLKNEKYPWREKSNLFGPFPCQSMNIRGTLRNYNGFMKTGEMEYVMTLGRGRILVGEYLDKNLVRKV